MNLKILYEDNNIIAIDKPEGLASIAESDPSKKNLHSLLENILGYKVYIVHRLDKEVSGVILFTKNPDTHKLLNEQFMKSIITKKYIALVAGVINEDSGTINRPIRKYGSGKMGVDELKGKPSVTNFKVLKRYNSFTLLELKPETGRRHQLRVHLYSVGFPIAGDLRYGDKNFQKNFPRLMLHAKSIEFFSKERRAIKIESPLPDSFITILNGINNHIR